MLTAVLLTEATNLQGQVDTLVELFMEIVISNTAFPPKFSAGGAKTRAQRHVKSKGFGNCKYTIYYIYIYIYIYTILKLSTNGWIRRGAYNGRQGG